MTKFGSAAVAEVFAAYPARVRARLLTLRALVLRTAAGLPDVGPLEETLKWGQPSYLTRASGSGTTIRLDAVRGHTDRCAMYFHCQTTLVATFRKKFGRTFRYEGNRALIFPVDEDLPVTELGACIALALTYHRRESPTRIPIRHRIR